MDLDADPAARCGYSLTKRSWFNPWSSLWNFCKSFCWIHLIRRELIMKKLDCRWFRFNVRHSFTSQTMRQTEPLKNQVRMVHEFCNGFTLNRCDNDGRKLMQRVAHSLQKIYNRDPWGEINGCYPHLWVAFNKWIILCLINSKSKYDLNSKIHKIEMQLYMLITEGRCKLCPWNQPCDTINFICKR